MNNVLDTLLREYDQKRINAEVDLERRKKRLYEELPRLEKIETELNTFAIATTKSMLKKNDTKSLEELHNKIAKLKKEKEKILKDNGYDTSYLKPFYECKICNDSGFTVENR